jgi:hypothetical protein
MTTYVKGSPSHWLGDMTHTVTVYKASTLDNYGKRTIAGTGTNYNCHLILEKSNSRDEQGNQVSEGGKLYILSDADIDTSDRLDLPNTNIDPRITSVKKVRYMANGVSTVHHTLVSFGALNG